MKSGPANYKHLLQFTICLLLAGKLFAQTDGDIKGQLKSDIAVLTSPAMHGRGYVNNGRQYATAFIKRRFSDLGLKKAPGSKTYLQEYTFPVNTFPGKMQFIINGKELKAGDDYLIDASAASFSGKELDLETADLQHIQDSTQLRLFLGGMDSRKAYCLLHTATACKALNIRLSELTARLPTGCYIISQEAKLTWTVARKQDKATVFFVKQESMPLQPTKLSAAVEARFEAKAPSANIIAQVPGTIKDTFIVFSGHYDHLGMMGADAMFPGASDNASGTAMMLYMAGYYATHPQRYSILFIAFSGEEAGLMGSQYFVTHPLIPLQNIKFLINTDIMGDATDGVTVVNATEYPDQFARLNKINDEHKYLPVIKSRGKAANSDHYYFSEEGVPAFFLYSNGGKGHYHDIFDTAAELTLNNIDGVVQLLTDFANSIR